MAIGVNMSKAKDIWRDRIREERKPKLEALDVEFMKAVETGDSDAQASISSKKQALRDATDDPAIALATTPEQLKQVRPAALDQE